MACSLFSDPHHYAFASTCTGPSHSPSPGSSQLFDMNSETTNFGDLGHYVSIFAIALSDIDPYIREECDMMQQSGNTCVESSPSKIK
ncbi:hypothetical protein ID866_6469, partial [Astraeus odoratus]